MIGRCFIAVSAFMAAVVVAGAAPAGAMPARHVVPLGAATMKVFFWPSFVESGNQGTVSVRSVSTISAVTREINSYPIHTHPFGGAGEPLCHRPKLRSRMSYTLRFSYSDRVIFIFASCGTIWRPQAGWFSFVKMPLAYRLAGIVQTVTHSKRLCRQWWHGHRLRLCRLNI
jgi:hypothetical protein